MNIKAFFLIFALILVSKKGFNQDIFDINNSQKYADYLFNTENYESAIGEYERCLFLKDSIYFKQRILVCYKRANLFEGGFKRIKTLNIAKSDTLIEESIKLLLKAKKYALADSLIGLLKYTDGNEYYLKTNLLAGNFLKSKEYLKAYTDKASQKSIKYSAILDDSEKLKLKKPWKAIVLSTLVPGLGKVYAKDWKDGLISFVSIGSFGYQAYRGFSKNGIKSFKGWAMGGITMGFYLGNIFGSAKSTKKYNFNINETFQDKIRLACLDDL
jgi:tetratricopeptide (TPR) repeat protein